MTHQDDTRSLTRAIASGDPDAFTRLYNEWFGWVVNEICRITGRDEQFALDITQDVMLKAARKMKPLPSSSALAAWFRTTALRCALTRLRSEQRRAKRERAAASSAERLNSPTHSAEHTRWIRNALGALDVETRTLIEARFRLGYTLRSVGSLAGITPSAADGRLNRSLNSLRKQAHDDGMTDDD